jgi:transposase
MRKRGQAYAQDLRDRVFGLADVGRGVCEIALMLLVSISYVSKVLGRRRETGETTARPQRCHVPRKLEALEPALAAHVKAHPDATLVELQAWLQATHAVTASTTLISETLLRLDLTRKKRRCTPPSRTVLTWPRPVPGGATTNPA